MLGRAPALALSDTLAQRGFGLLPESVIAQRVIVGKTFADVMNVELRDLSSKEFPIGALRSCSFAPNRTYKSWSLKSGSGSPQACQR